MARPLLTSLRDQIAHYEWANGRLVEQDSDTGPVGEFFVGIFLGIAIELPDYYHLA